MKKVKSVAERKSDKIKLAEIKANLGKVNSVAALRQEVEKLLALVEGLFN